MQRASSAAVKSVMRASFELTGDSLLTPGRRDDRMHLKGAASLLTVILLVSTHVQALQYSYQPGRRLLQCTTQAACIARCPAGNSPIYLAPQGGASGQCVCICQPTQSSPTYQNSPNLQNSPASQQGGSSGAQQDSSTGVQQDSTSLQNSPARSGGLINTNVGGNGGGGSSNFGTLGSGLSGGSSSGYGSGAVTGTSGGGDYGSASQSSSQGSATSALVGAVTSTSGSGAGSGSSSSAATGSVSSSGSSARTGAVGAVGSGR
ncbi:g498 [Coccomyxa viridis]|uniref:G498 protein n=1 Tax=Coccomyxa viridis TaxID=1274662 RepID=A0ABP1FJV7_9CHLO